MNPKSLEIQKPDDPFSNIHSWLNVGYTDYEVLKLLSISIPCVGRFMLTEYGKMVMKEQRDKWSRVECYYEGDDKFVIRTFFGDKLHSFNDHPAEIIFKGRAIFIEGIGYEFEREFKNISKKFLDFLRSNFLRISRECNHETCSNSDAFYNLDDIYLCKGPKERDCIIYNFLVDDNETTKILGNTFIIKEWYRNGSEHREVGPQYISPWETKYKKNGLYHRDNGPAYEMDYESTGEKNYYKMGKLHNTKGPALIRNEREAGYFDEEFYINGVMNREVHIRGVKTDISYGDDGSVSHRKIIGIYPWAICSVRVNKEMIEIKDGTVYEEKLVKDNNGGKKYDVYLNGKFLAQTRALSRIY